MTIKINFNDGTYKVLKNPSGQKIATLYTLNLDRKGTCTIEYAAGYSNEFEFDSYDDFIEKFKPCIEKELLKWMDIK